MSISLSVSLMLSWMNLARVTFVLHLIWMDGYNKLKCGQCWIFIVCFASIAIWVLFFSVILYFFLLKRCKCCCCCVFCINNDDDDDQTKVYPLSHKSIYTHRVLLLSHAYRMWKHQRETKYMRPKKTICALVSV